MVLGSLFPGHKPLSMDKVRTIRQKRTAIAVRFCVLYVLCATRVKSITQPIADEVDT
jgi:hypothetical protein